jgi:hypothetical protein
MSVGILVEPTRDRGTPRRVASDAARLKLSTEVMQIVAPDMHSRRAHKTEEAEACPGPEASSGRKKHASNGGEARISASINRA